MEEERKLKNAPVEFRNHVNFIINMYEKNEYGLIHGFQKDAIQNALGARNVKDNWEHWKCEIYVEETNKGKFIIVEDSGTHGLTGKNRTIEEISIMCANSEVFPEDQRLSRMSCQNVSNNLAVGAGLFGVGKILYSAASKTETCTYLFDSIIEGGEYRLNINNACRLFENGAILNDEAREYLKEKTGLKPKSTMGTRFIILDPKDEIVEAIEDGTLLKYAEETWWRVLPFCSEEGGIYINHKKAKIPEGYDPSNIDDGYYYESKKPQLVYDTFRAKRVGFGICKKLDPLLTGFYFYRRGMKIGKIDVKEIPESIQSRCYGFIELEPEYENELATIEDSTHYGILTSKKNLRIYSALKDFVKDNVHNILLQWGFIKSAENENKRLYEVARNIQHDIQSLFKQSGLEDIGKGDIKKEYMFGFKNVVYPNPDVARTVYTDDKLKFQIYISNKSLFTQNYKVTIQVTSKNLSKIIYENNVEVDGFDKFESDKIILDINEQNAERWIDNAIVLSVVPKAGKKEHSKKIYFYYDVETKKNAEKDFGLIMSNRLFPRKNDKRINSDESLKDVQYKIFNNLSTDATFLLSVSTHNMESSGEIIEKVFSKKYTVRSCEEVETDPFEIFFNKELYEDRLLKGSIQIRAKIVLLDRAENYQKGFIADKYSLTIYFNKNEKKGMEDSFNISIKDNPDDCRCSWLEGRTGNRILVINIGHPEFQILDNDGKERYIAHQMIREFMLLYLVEGKFNAVLSNDPDGSNTEVTEIISQLNAKVDEMWWRQCQRS